MKKQILISASIIVLALGFIFFTRNSSPNSGTLFEIEAEDLEMDEDGYEDETHVVKNKIEESNSDLSGTIFVDVQGEVVNPNVFEVDRNVRVGYLIDLAGGLTDYANVRGLNRAARVYDEMVIFIPHVNDVAEVISEPDTSNIEGANDDGSDLISLSTASAIQLQTLPGIGPTLSANIIAHRDTNGAFSTIEELVNVPGIGAGILENIREFIKP